MLCAEKVRAAVATLTGLSEDALAEYTFLIEGAVQSVAESTQEPDSAQALRLAAAKAAYEIALSRQGDGVTSFKAGDVSITMNGDAVKNAKAVYEQALSDCAGSIDDSGFVFRAI